ncbi:MAG: hypothetical protein K2X99_02000 [Gemmatimonadaceae bacterium]|nr:hypothetical protein [Gemmatimonadaceae bacterium]
MAPKRVAVVDAAGAGQMFMLYVVTRVLTGTVFTPSESRPVGVTATVVPPGTR